MAAVQVLSQFNLAETEDGYLLEVGGSGGSLLTLSASPEQIDAVIEALLALRADDEDDDAIGPEDETPG